VPKEIGCHFYDSLFYIPINWYLIERDKEMSRKELKTICKPSGENEFFFLYSGELEGNIITTGRRKFPEGDYISLVSDKGLCNILGVEGIGNINDNPWNFDIKYDKALDQIETSIFIYQE